MAKKKEGGKKILMLLSRQALRAKEFHLLLSKAGYNVVASPDMTKFTSNDAIDLIIVDCDDSVSQSTSDRLREIRGRFPSVYLMLLSRAPIPISHQISLQSDYNVNAALVRPIDPDVLLDHVHALLD
ncbi:Uncharacterised protein [uncultured archaeon]|nr:Uncharacterised protein [uncultured archaeon]